MPLSGWKRRDERGQALGEIVFFFMREFDGGDGGGGLGSVVVVEEDVFHVVFSE